MTEHQFAISDVPLSKPYKAIVDEQDNTQTSKAQMFSVAST